jgi:hypothetical protein
MERAGLSSNRAFLMVSLENQNRMHAQAAQAMPVAPLSPPATPETPLQTHPTMTATQGSSSLGGYESFQTAAEADYLFDPPGMERYTPVLEQTYVVAAPADGQSMTYRGRGRGRGHSRGSFRGRGRGGYFKHTNNSEEAPHEGTSQVRVDGAAFTHDDL